MTEVTCSVCGEQVGKMGIGNHGGMHRRHFREWFGRPPENYDEVREKLTPEIISRVDDGYSKGGSAELSAFVNDADS